MGAVLDHARPSRHCSVTLPAKPSTSLALQVLTPPPCCLPYLPSGMDAAKLAAMAEKLNIKVPSMTSEMTSSLEELKKLPALLQV